MPATPRRPRLSARLLFYVLADAFGGFCLAIGSSWFIAGKGVIVAGIPNSPAEAVAACAGGLAVMAWAMLRLLRELHQSNKAQ